MRLPILRAAVLAAAILPALAAAAPLTLDEAVQRSVQRSEAARAARAGATSARESAHAAGQLPDPMLGVRIENLPVTGPERFSTTREGMTMKSLMLSQEWVPAEKRALREAAAGAAVAREGANVAASVADTRLQAALAYIDAYFAGESLQLAVSSEHHADEALRVAKARALADGRDYLVPDDVKAVAVPVLAHRLIVGPEARSAGLAGGDLVVEALERTPVPV